MGFIWVFRWGRSTAVCADGIAFLAYTPANEFPGKNSDGCGMWSCKLCCLSEPQHCQQLMQPQVTISQTPALQGHPQSNGDAHQQAGDVKSLLAPADTKMGNKWCKSAGSTKCTRANICFMQAWHWKRAPRYSVYPRIFCVFSWSFCKWRPLKN